MVDNLWHMHAMAVCQALSYQPCMLQRLCQGLGSHCTCAVHAQMHLHVQECDPAYLVFLSCRTHALVWSCVAHDRVAHGRCWQLVTVWSTIAQGRQQQASTVCSSQVAFMRISCCFNLSNSSNNNMPVQQQEGALMWKALINCAPVMESHLSMWWITSDGSCVQKSVAL